MLKTDLRLGQPTSDSVWHQNAKREEYWEAGRPGYHKLCVSERQNGHYRRPGLHSHTLETTKWEPGWPSEAKCVSE